MIVDWPIDLLPSRSRAWRFDRRRRRRHDLAAHREDPVHPPDALLEVAVLDRRHGRDEQVAHRVPAEPPARPTGPVAVAREPVLEQLAHERLGVGERGDAVADVADGRDAELARAARPDEPPSSATVTIAVRLLVCSLSPRSSVDSPVPAADRDDPRAARQEPLLVDDLDERLVASSADGAGP